MEPHNASNRLITPLLLYNLFNELADRLLFAHRQINLLTLSVEGQEV
jgi:hypothetical protein